MQQLLFYKTNWHLGTVANYALYDVIKIVFKSFQTKRIRFICFNSHTNEKQQQQQQQLKRTEILFGSHRERKAYEHNNINTSTECVY